MEDTGNLDVVLHFIESRAKAVILSHLGLSLDLYGLLRFPGVSLMGYHQGGLVC